MSCGIDASQVHKTSHPENNVHPTAICQASVQQSIGRGEQVDAVDVDTVMWNGVLDVMAADEISRMYRRHYCGAVGMVGRQT